tara:strand:+ start:196 stop:321 length:126 start_codon:yes stop_codon:yes gene_type:complete
LKDTPTATGVAAGRNSGSEEETPLVLFEEEVADQDNKEERR